MSEVKVNKITPRAACGTTQLGDSGDTFTIPSGATITNLGTATGFGGTGVVSWDTSSIKTTGFTATSGIGYFCNTTGGAFTVTLPASPTAGDVVGVSDYAKTFDTYALTLGRNSEKIGGGSDDAILAIEGAAVTLVYVDSTKGWIVTDSGLQSDAPGPLFLTATGGTPCSGAISGDYKIHTFTGPGTFTVSCAGNSAGSNTVDYMIVGGGGGGGSGNGGGGGGGSGGWRASSGTSSGSYCAGPAPLTGPVSALSLTATPYAIVIGGGGAGGAGAPACGSTATNGDASSGLGVSSAGGGGGGGTNALPCRNGLPGGSGGGSAKGPATGGTGNAPPVSPAQGNAGGGSTCAGGNCGGGGGGAADQGETVTWVNARGGNGGIGVTSTISTTPTQYAGGGGANSEVGGVGGTGGVFSGGGTPSPCAGPSSPRTPGFGGGLGHGGAGSSPNTSTAGGTNTGGGGGGIDTPAPYNGGNGGSGIVIIRYKFQ